MTPRFRDWIGVFGSRNGTLDPESCDYALAYPNSLGTKGFVVVVVNQLKSSYRK